ncbi:uncharacterized protein [Triticum aestivum]|uniref:uncharacterized protein n=1 Tax=Triticum aestivum TaxID=4565 RepID=UPI001D035BEB|nr:uncharacterized protein LOC123144691 [Triticum aestivum]
MDPALKAYLDKMSDEATARANKQDGDNNAILQALATQTARIDSLVTWKPELEARFAQLELSVAALQAASSSTAPSIGSPPLATPTMVAREIQGQSGHGVPGGSLSVTPESPSTSPVTGLVQVAAGQSGTAQAQVAYGSAFNNLPAQTTQAYGMPYAYTNPMAGYQDVQASGHAGYPVASYDQNAIPYYTIYPGYPAGYDQNGLPYYTGYPAGDDQNAMHFYLVAYAATAVGVPATDAANMDGNAGSPAGAGQAESTGHITLASDAPPVAAIGSPLLEK